MSQVSITGNRTEKSGRLTKPNQSAEIYRKRTGSIIACPFLFYSKFFIASSIWLFSKLSR